jgi:hypothetical protein
VPQMPGPGRLRRRRRGLAVMKVPRVGHALPPSL